MSTERPPLWPLHDRLGTNIVPAEQSLYIQNGYPPLLPVPSDDHNGKLQRAGLWHKYLDLNGLRNEDWLDISAMHVDALTSSALSYTNGGNVLTTGGVVASRAAYLIEGTRVETDSPFLNPIGGSVTGDPLLFADATVPGRIWIYANGSGNVRYESVAPGTADNPAADEQALVGIDVDGTGVITDGAVAPTTAPLPARALTLSIPIGGTFNVSGNTVLDGTLTVDGAVDFDSTLTVVGQSMLSSFETTGGGVIGTGLDVTTNLDVFQNASVGGTLTVTGTSDFQASVTITDAQPTATLNISKTGGAGYAILVGNSSGLGGAIVASSANASNPTVSASNNASSAAVSATNSGTGAALALSRSNSADRGTLALGMNTADHASPVIGDLSHVSPPIVGGRSRLRLYADDGGIDGGTDGDVTLWTTAGGLWQGFEASEGVSSTSSTSTQTKLSVDFTAVNAVSRINTPGNGYNYVLHWSCEVAITGALTDRVVAEIFQDGIGVTTVAGPFVVVPSGGLANYVALSGIVLLTTPVGSAQIGFRSFAGNAGSVAIRRARFFWLGTLN